MRPTTRREVERALLHWQRLYAPPPEPKNKRPRLRDEAEDKKKLNRPENYTASVESCNKWLTIWRYTQGFLSFEGCEAAFDAHPDWRAA